MPTAIRLDLEWAKSSIYTILERMHAGDWSAFTGTREEFVPPTYQSEAGGMFFRGQGSIACGVIPAALLQNQDAWRATLVELLPQATAVLAVAAYEWIVLVFENRITLGGRTLRIIGGRLFDGASITPIASLRNVRFVVPGQIEPEWALPSDDGDTLVNDTLCLRYGPASTPLNANGASAYYDPASASIISRIGAGRPVSISEIAGLPGHFIQILSARGVTDEHWFAVLRKNEGGPQQATDLPESRRAAVITTIDGITSSVPAERIEVLGLLRNQPVGGHVRASIGAGGRRIDINIERRDNDQFLAYVAVPCVDAQAECDGVVSLGRSTPLAYLLPGTGSVPELVRKLAATGAPRNLWRLVVTPNQEMCAGVGLDAHKGRNFVAILPDGRPVVWAEGAEEPASEFLFGEAGTDPEELVALARLETVLKDPRTGTKFTDPEERATIRSILRGGIDLHDTPSLRIITHENDIYAWPTSFGALPFVSALSTRHHATVLVPQHLAGTIHKCWHCNNEIECPEFVAKLESESGEEVEGVWLCGSCRANAPRIGTVTRGYDTCEDCGLVVHRSRMRVNVSVCEECFIDHYGTCSVCGGEFHLDNLAGDRCSSCRRNAGRIREYSFSPTPIFHKIAQEPLFFGVEIELENPGGDVDASASEVLNYPGCANFLYAKRDGSLNNGAEFVSHPFSWAWFMQNKARFADIFAKMNDEAFVAKKTCGLHIHVSRTPHTGLEEFRTMQLMYENRAFWSSISRRADLHYCRLDDPATVLRERVRVARDRSTFTSRYVALNPTSKRTLEWRLWAGTSQFERFASALALTAGAHDFARSGKLGIKPSIDKFKSFITNHGEFGPLAAPRLASA